MEGISEAVAAIEHELDEIASRSQKVKAAVRQFSAASSSSAKKAQEPFTNGDSASPLGENPKVPIALQRFWRAQQERVVPAGSNVASINTEKKRNFYSLYGIWEELSSRAEDVQMRYQSTSRSHMNLFMHEEVKKEKQAEHALTCLHRTLMDPHSTARLVWSFVGLLCVIFDAFSIPVIVSWEIPNSEIRYCTGIL